MEQQDRLVRIADPSGVVGLDRQPSTSETKAVTRAEANDLTAEGVDRIGECRLVGPDPWRVEQPIGRAPAQRAQADDRYGRRAHCGRHATDHQRPTGVSAAWSASNTMRLQVSRCSAPAATSSGSANAPDSLS